MNKGMNYQGLIEEFAISGINELHRLFDQEIIYDWIRFYEGISAHGEMTIQNFFGYTFAIDDGNHFTTDTENPKEMLEGRVVAVFGISNQNINHGNRKMMRKWIGNTGEVFSPYGDNYDKGHFIAHGFGGPIDVDLFPQRLDINRDGVKKRNLTGKWKSLSQPIPVLSFFQGHFIPIYLFARLR